MKRFDPAFLLFLFLSLWSFGAHSQTTIDFNAVEDAGGFGTTFGDVDPADANEIAMAGGFLFTIDGPGVSSSNVQIIGVQNDGYDGTNAMRIQSFNEGDVTKWTIKKSNSEAFQFRGIHLRQREGHGSTSGTITGYKDGVATGSAPVNFTITNNQLHDFSANSVFFDVDEIVIEAADLYVILDHFTHGSPVSVADQDPAEVLGISLVGNPVSTATSVTYAVTFSKPAHHVDISDFELTTIGSATAALGMLTGGNGSTSYTLTLNNIAGEGGLRLDLKAGTDIQNADGTGGTAAFTGGQVHRVGSCFTETFDHGVTNGATSFSGNGKTFSLIGNWTIITDIPNNGLGGSAYNLKNNGAGPYTIVSNDGKISVQGLYLYVSSFTEGDDPTNDGSITIRGLRDGNQVYTFTKSSGFATDHETVEDGTFISGYTRIKFSDHGTAGELIDQLEISLDGSFTYLNLDNFSWCLDFVPPSGYSASIDQSPIRPFNTHAVSFTFANAEVGATYEYSISSTGGGGTVTGSGTVLSPSQQVTGIDLSGLGNGTVTLSTKLIDPSGNQGSTVTATVQKTNTDAPFITRWRTTVANETITIQTNPNVTGYNYMVNWGDGNTTSGHTGNASHTYAVAGTFTVTISGVFPALYRAGAQLISVEQWGDMAWTSMERAFADAIDLKINASDAPDLSAVVSTELMFANATNFNADLTGWDVSSVQNMQGMFQNTSAFNGDLSGWTTSSVTNMVDMFRETDAFNQSLSSWDVSSVKNMQGMFQDATAFNGDLSGWTPTSVTNMVDMFR
ncbi:MAG TPA: BspA family leucine-rich repeat surface protein, partial [Sphingobacteriaceae bacterium]|nr:BspA family leucine-rich repeat surface protein [Sphingobacteriaceae bacterium]